MASKNRNLLQRLVNCHILHYPRVLDHLISNAVTSISRYNLFSK